MPPGVEAVTGIVSPAKKKSARGRRLQGPSPEDQLLYRNREIKKTGAGVRNPRKLNRFDGSGTSGSFAGRATELGAWIDPNTGIEHLSLMTRNGDRAFIHFASSASPQWRSYEIHSRAESVEIDPQPTVTNCVLRLAAREEPRSRVADLRLEGAGFERVSGSLLVR